MGELYLFIRQLQQPPAFSACHPSYRMKADLAADLWGPHTYRGMTMETRREGRRRRRRARSTISPYTGLNTKPVAATRVRHRRRSQPFILCCRYSTLVGWNKTPRCTAEFHIKLPKYCFFMIHHCNSSSRGLFATHIA